MNRADEGRKIRQEHVYDITEGPSPFGGSEPTVSSTTNSGGTRPVRTLPPGLYPGQGNRQAF